MKINSNYIYYSFVFLLTCIQVNAQNTGATIKLNNGVTNFNRFFVYESDFRIKPEYQKLSQVTNDCPESLLMSSFSAINQEWVNFNTFGGSDNAELKSEKHFNAIKSMDKNRNYFELAHKLYFSIEEREYCIVKYYIHSQYSDKVISAVSTMMLKDKRWYFVRDYVSGLNALMFMRIKSDKLYDLLYSPSKDEMLQSVAAKISDDGGVNFNKLTLEFNSWYLKGNETYKAYFVDEKAW